MKRATVTIDDVAPEKRLTLYQRRALLEIGAWIDAGRPAADANYPLPKPTKAGRTLQTLEQRGYIVWSARLRFELTSIGAMRYRAELSHQRRCAGCSMCEGLR